MSKYVVRALPGLPSTDLPYQFEIFDDLELNIPADIRGPDVRVADRPEQEAWLFRYTDGLTSIWDCRWRFSDADAVRRFLIVTGAEPLALVVTSPPSSPLTARVTSDPVAIPPPLALPDTERA